MSKVVLIPGAYSSKHTWNYFKDQLPKNADVLLPEYCCEHPLDKVVDDLAKFVAENNPSKEDVMLVGHSLGGVISFALADKIPEVKKVVAIASPFGGIMISRWMNHVSFTMSALTTFANQIPYLKQRTTDGINAYRTFWCNIHPDNSVLREVRSKPLECESVVFVMEHKGMNIWLEPSDGTVTVKSQMGLGDRKNLTYVKVEGNHMDGVLNSTVATAASNFLFPRPVSFPFFPQRKEKVLTDQLVS